MPRWPLTDVYHDSWCVYGSLWSSHTSNMHGQCHIQSPWSEGMRDARRMSPWKDWCVGAHRLGTTSSKIKSYRVCYQYVTVIISHEAMMVSKEQNRGWRIRWGDWGGILYQISAMILHELGIAIGEQTWTIWFCLKQAKENRLALWCQCAF